WRRPRLALARALGYATAADRTNKPALVDRSLSRSPNVRATRRPCRAGGAANRARQESHATIDRRRHSLCRSRAFQSTASRWLHTQLARSALPACRASPRRQSGIRAVRWPAWGGRHAPRRNLRATQTSQASDRLDNHPRTAEQREREILPQEWSCRSLQDRGRARAAAVSQL